MAACASGRVERQSFDLLHHHRGTGGEAAAPPRVGGVVALLRRLGHGWGSIMGLITRRHVVAASGTLAVGLNPRKPRAEELHDLAAALVPTDPPVPAPDIAFVAADGSEHHLSDFLGH